ncbi:hypothetical protein FRC04_008443 [Tulasnella sp. 424]|nr:hypothetical protein FRC04_008443 [Tulasnella sp. 424]KAG8959061.1 hypothetical protein FRC05_008153 [Tulasnella sp. 425]
MLHKPSFVAILASLASVEVVNAWFRLPCAQPMVQERVDPIIAPGQISQHLHSIHGGSNFGMNVTYNSLRQSTCTSCQVAQDLSNYWTPTLYFKDPVTGQFEKVPNGGLLVYYQNRGTADVANGGKGLKAFPPGFRMITGDPKKRSKIYQEGLGTPAELAERAIKSTCLRYTTNNPSYDFYGFPTTDCEAGLNSRLHMPACWDGVNLDSPDHKSHTAYLSQIDNGSCPPTHPVPLMKLFYEVTWDIQVFSNRWKGKPWPFVWSNSDPTGYGWHGDFFNGWDVGVLQNAIDHCNQTPDQLNGIVQACPYFTIIPATTTQACRAKTTEVPESINGPMAKLPGCNPLQYGPGDATLYSTSNCPI